MNRIILLLTCFCVFSNTMAQESINIIPAPQQITQGQGFFQINKETKIIDLTKNTETRLALKPLIEKLQKSAGIQLSFQSKISKSNSIVVQFDKSLQNTEGYVLTISPSQINIKAVNASGVFYAVQSILQLLPTDIEQSAFVPTINCKVPSLTINDAPRFPYRGIMLDVSRHFMPVTFIKKYLDELAALKLNRFHWHLTDGQAFRFESKKYPLLHTAKSPQWPTNEGFYSQAEMRDIVKYAAERFITIIPEIDVPAHSNAALVAYPQFACLDSTGKQLLLQGEFCPKESSIAFVNDILDEVMDIFPSKYIHIGGDEASKTAWHKCPNCQQRMKDKGLKSIDELQSDFIKSIEQHVNQKGRQIIGWDEILDGGLAPNATVMAWRSIESGGTAAKLKHHAIISPTSHCYLDYYQSEDPNEPLAFGGFINLPKIYSFEPIPEGLTKEEEGYILGGQANLWTEQVPVGSHVEYMTFPRAVALAEVDWSPKASRNYDDFLNRLGSYLNRMDIRQVNYAKHFFEIKTKMLKGQGNGIQLALSCDNGNAPIYYTLDGSSPTLSSNIYKEPINITNSTTMKASTVMKGKLVDEITRTITYNKATGVLINLTTPADKRYTRGGAQALTNGMFGGESQFGDEEWLGWNGLDFGGTLDFWEKTAIQKATFRFFHKPSSWIWIPSQVQILGSSDGVNFEEISSQNIAVPAKEGVTKVTLSFNQKTVRYIKVIARSFGTIPANSTGAGDKPWLFVDEIVVE
ncbi:MULTISPECIES: family 20 glycosylhydrolase [unclassified Arcicella]|uniref:beta-N-acetylhexosaminidase n=1 Tax=unclassified Arcicella TaxID=2644986 RepID=UPI00285AF4CB|nr:MULTISPECIES: family 20 glycosylhydrolase [unclassified Arcicella]MDR6563246.1 hexosaminidase [Arcicella sp. BE51]MDR6811603.1 hexosaminidase [Arcicella sp. BE140]MDR6823129.1 hexosaminidase [Arcicella sp. BE139]